MPDDNAMMPSAPARPVDTVSSLRVFLAVALPMFIGMMDQTIVAAALADIARHFDSFGQIGLAVTAYLAAATVAAPVYGRLGDAFGCRKMLIVALCVALAGSVVCMFAPNFPMLILGRVVQGMGGGGLMSLSQALLGQRLTPRERASYQGYLACIAIAAAMVGPVVGGFLSGTVGWRWIFAVNLGIGAGAMLFLTRLPARPTLRRGARMQMDWIGLATFAVLTLGVIALSDQIRAGDVALRGMLWVMAAGLAVLLIGLVWYERKSTHPLLPLDLLRRPAIVFPVVLTVLHGALFVSLLTAVPVYFAFGRGLAADQAGLWMLPMTMAIGVGSFFTGQMIGRSGRTAIYPTLMLPLAGAILCGIAMFLSGLQMVWIVAGLALVSASLGTVMGVVQITVQIEVVAERMASATALVSLSRSLGAVIGTAVTGAWLGAVIRAQDKGGFDTVFWGLGVLALCAGVVAWMMPRRKL